MAKVAAMGIARGAVLGVVFVMGLTHCRSAQAQDGLTYDPTARVYTLEYIDDSGEPRVSEIVPPDHIDPEIELVVASDDPLDYQYTIVNEPSAGVDQGIGRLEIECPNEILEVEAPAGWYVVHEVSANTGLTVCAFGERSEPILPGTQLDGFGVRSPFLPGIVGVDVWGRLEHGVAEFPGIVDARPELMEIADSIQGITGGWVEDYAVAPATDPASLLEAADGIEHVLSVSSEACNLGWVEETNGVCHSLEVKLEQARASIIADRPAARQQLEAFLNELEAQRGQHVTETAYWLLRLLGEHVLSTI